jgi:hypothetical protein
VENLGDTVLKVCRLFSVPVPMRHSPRSGAAYHAFGRDISCVRVWHFMRSRVAFHPFRAQRLLLIALSRGATIFARVESDSRVGDRAWWVVDDIIIIKSNLRAFECLRDARDPWHRPQPSEYQFPGGCHKNPENGVLQKILPIK